MDINSLLEQFEIIIDKIEENVSLIEKDTDAGIKAMTRFIQQIQTVLPDWFYFIEQTGIGEKQIILNILTDIFNGIDGGDSVLLVDSLLFGMQGLMIEYREIIKEALE